jgi:hypothetical protein
MYNPDLNKDRIIKIASFIIEIRGEVIERHDKELGDTPLSLGMRAYECCRSRIITLADSGRWSWLSNLTPRGRFTFRIGDTPVRFVRNNPRQLPDNKMIVSPEAQRQMSLFKVGSGYSALRWFFVFDTYYKNPGDLAYFVGYDEYKNIECLWQIPLEEKVSFLAPLDSPKSKPVDVPKSKVTPKLKLIKKQSDDEK